MLNDHRFLTALLLLSLGLFTGCDDQERPAPAPETPRVTDPVALYAARCASCHGEDGSGTGPAAATLETAPRDLRSGTIKFASVASGFLPRDEDLARLIRRGVPGAGMPASPDLDEEQVRGLVARVKSFSDRWSEEPAGDAVVVSEDPFVGSASEAESEGRMVYHAVARCYACHASYVSATELRGLERQASVEPGEAYREQFWRPVPQVDEWEHEVVPPEFTRDTLRGGSELSDLTRTLACGVGGTSMPGWKDVLEDRQIWALAYYIRSLDDLDVAAASTLMERLRASAAASGVGDPRSSPGT